MGERIDALKSFGKKYFSVFNTVTKAKESLGNIQSPTWKEVPPTPKGNAFLTEGMKGWAYCAISAIADDVASNPALLYQKRGKNWSAVDNHPVLDLINKPNPYQTKEEVLWLTTAYMLTIGEAMWVLDDSTNPKEFVVFNPTRVTVNFDKEEMVKSYTLTLSDGRRQEVPAENVVFFKLPSFQTPFRGTGVLEHISEAIDVDNFVQEYIRIFFYNNAAPSSVLQTDLELTEEIAKRMLKQFETRHRGIKNSHKLAILEKGLKFSNIDRSFSEMQMNELDTRIRDRILAAFRVPKSILGIIDEVNRANAEASDRNFSKRAVMPKLRFIEAQINQYLIPKFSDGRNLWFEFENPVMEDELVKAQVRQIYVFSGIRTANEFRQEDGLIPLADEEGDMPESDDVEKMVNGKKSKLIERKKGLSSSERKMKAVDDAIYKEAEGIVSKKTKGVLEDDAKVRKTPFKDAEVEAYHMKKIENTAKIENEFAQRVSLYRKKQKKDILTQLSGKRRKKAALEIKFDEDQEAALLSALSYPYMERSLLAQAALTAALINIDNTLDTQDNRVKAFLSKWSGKLGKSNSQTTKEFIEKTLREWGANDEATIPDLKKTFTEYFDDPSKADMIARSETARASGYATETVYKDAGAVGKKWAAAIDERVCEYCDALDGEIVGISENFIDSGDSITGRDGGLLTADYGPIPAEPSHPGCRCDILPVFDFDKSASFSFRKFQKQMMQIDSEKKNIELGKQDLEKAKSEHEKKVAEELEVIKKMHKLDLD